LKATRDLPRLAAWALVPLAAAAFPAARLAFAASRDLALGRERLLAGAAADATAAFTRARRWPAAAAAADAGVAVAAARAGRTGKTPVPLGQLELFAPEALLRSVLEEGRLDAAAALADLARRAGHPVGGLYAAVAAFERGDEAGARARARESAAPIESRGLGRRLKRALEARDSGATTLLFDRRGELAATLGRDGRLEATTDAAPLLAGTLERLGPMPPRPAVRLAIDLHLSRLALQALGGTRGSIVVVEPRTGAVLAAASDLRTATAEGGASFEQRREPASIAKLLTAAAAYRAGLDADTEIRRMTCRGVERYGGEPLWCPFPAGPLAGLDHALALSCNVAFASLGVRVGAERLVAEHRLWGFEAEEGASLGAGRVHTRPRTPRQVAGLAVGLDSADITPLHATLLAAVVANDGLLVEPSVARGACSPLGLTDDPWGPASARRVIEPAVARRLRAAMEAVASHGTGGGLAPPGFRVAMKTGTAAERRLGYHVNYIGLGPLPDPSFAFCVRVTHERSSPAVTRAAREVTGRLLESLARIREPSRTWTAVSDPDRTAPP
jgi:peptidoglycan glycosyltransferase